MSKAFSKLKRQNKRFSRAYRRGFQHGKKQVNPKLGEYTLDSYELREYMIGYGDGELNRLLKYL